METVQLQGVQYVTDSAGKRAAVLISLEEWGEMWEDFYGVLVSHAQSNPLQRVSWYQTLNSFGGCWEADSHACTALR